MTIRLYKRASVAAALLAAAAGVVVTSGPAESDRLMLVGSGSNNGDPKCHGVQNSSCTGGSNGGGPVKSFGVHVADVRYVYPASREDMGIEFSNPHAFDIEVRSLALTVSDPDGEGGCSASDLVRPESPVTSAVVVPRRGSADTAISVGLRADAPPECQGVTWGVTVTATAVKR